MAETALVEAPTPKYKHLTQPQLVALLHLRELGKTQVEIAEALGCDQTTVGRALRTFTDTRAPATAYLQSGALRMAKNIVNKGLPRDHVAALKGIGVLEQDRSGDINLTVGVALQGAVSPPSSE